MSASEVLQKTAWYLFLLHDNFKVTKIVNKERGT